LRGTQSDIEKTGKREIGRPTAKSLFLAGKSTVPQKKLHFGPIFGILTAFLYRVGYIPERPEFFRHENGVDEKFRGWSRRRRDGKKFRRIGKLDGS